MSKPGNRSIESIQHKEQKKKKNPGKENRASETCDIKRSTVCIIFSPRGKGEREWNEKKCFEGIVAEIPPSFGERHKLTHSKLPVNPEKNKYAIHT